MFVIVLSDNAVWQSRAGLCFWYRAVLLFCLVFTGGCASVMHESPAKDEVALVSVADMVTSTNSADDSGWWQVGFHRSIEADDEPLWHLDALIAYEVIKPILEQQQFRLWRFHRRAAPDASGHQFSFIFYAPRSTGEQIYQAIKAHPMVRELQQENLIERLSFFNINGDARSNIEDTSDKNWPVELQKAWPAYIMGVSQTWLNLIDEFARQIPAENNGITAQFERFEQINSRINSVWEMEGGHAFLHHLNALFGYQELYIIERRRTRF